MSTGFNWSAFLDVAGGVAAFLVGLAIFIALLAVARTLRRLDKTLDGVDEQVAALGRPVSETLAHVGGIADTADRTIARLAGVADSLERIAASISHTAKLTSDALSPAIVNVGATLGGVSAGLRRLVRGDESTGRGP